MKQVTLIGDSIRMGYLPHVARLLADDAAVWGPTINGGTSRNVLAHLEEWALARPADVVHINCGLHDLARDPDENSVIGETRVSLAEYESNLREILSRLQTAGRHVVWATTTPTHERHHYEVKSFERREADVALYDATARRIAEELGVPVNDLARVVVTAGRDRVLLPDGVHFTDEGYLLLGEAVVTFLRPLLE